MREPGCVPAPAHRTPVASARKEPIDRAAVVADAVQTCAHLIEGRRHRLEVSLPPQLVEPVDLEQLEQLLARRNAHGDSAGPRIL